MKTIPVFSVSMYITDALSSSPRKVSLGPTTLLERVYIPRDFRIIALSLGLGNELGNNYQQHKMVDYQKVSSAIFDSSFASFGDSSKIYEVKGCRLRLFTVRNGYAISNLEKTTDIAYLDKKLFGFYKPENEEFTIYVPETHKFIALELKRFLSRQTRLYYVLSDYGIVISRYTG